MHGILLGTLVGDALGLPYEGTRPEYVRRCLGGRALEHGFWLGRGMCSDDTEHACMVARAWIESGGEPDGFQRAFARALRRWCMRFPVGLGWATLRACLRLAVGVSPERSGVDSAGNAPAMRSAILGACATDDDHLRALVRAATRVTHTDPRAEMASLCVARWARDADRVDFDPFGAVELIEDDELRLRVRSALAWAAEGRALSDGPQGGDYAAGVSGYIVHTLPAVAYCWWRYRQMPEQAIEGAVRLGGDTDTVAAIVGALCGAGLGVAAFPQKWVDGVWDWPIDGGFIDALVEGMVDGVQVPRHLGGLVVARNLGFFAICCGHVGMRWGRRVGFAWRG